MIRNIMDMIGDRDQRELEKRAAAAELDLRALQAKQAEATGRRDTAATERKRLEATIAAMLADATTRRANLAAELGAEALGGEKVTARRYAEATEAIARLELGASGIASTALEAVKRAEWLADNAIGSLGPSIDAARNRAGTLGSGDVDVQALKHAEQVAKVRATVG